MLKVIIADDEEKVCRLICRLVDWNAFGMEIVDVVNDGKSAMEAIQTGRPDIVITDIRMPGYDGIELIERAKGVSPDTYFIIISGYSQFEYAKQAIRYGVENYLLKPLKKKELEATLYRILEKYNEVSRAATEKENLMQRLQQSEKKYKKNLIGDLMENSGKKEAGSELERLKAEYGCRFEKRCFAGVAVRPFLLQRGQSDRQVYELLLQKINQILETRLEAAGVEMVSAVYRDEVICVVNMEEDKMTAVKKELGKLRIEIINWREIFEKVEAVVGIGRVKTAPEELSDSVREADAAILNRMAYGMSGIIEYTEEEDEGRYVMDGETRSRILGCFERLDLDGLLREIGAKGSAANGAKGSAANGAKGSAANGAKGSAANGMERKAVPQTAAPRAEKWSGRREYECYKALVKLLLFGAGNFMPETEFEEESFFLEKYHTAYTLSEVYGWLSDYMEDQFRRHFEKRKNTGIMPIRQAKQYIAENYNTNLCLEDISRLVGFNPAYFSSLFKKETGKNFTEYVTEIRIGNARDMLVRSNRDIADIAAGVGYTDLKYFSRIFRKATGVNPSDYRKLYG